MKEMKAAAVIVAGGMGKRMESKTPKQFMNLCNKPVMQWSLECFDSMQEITKIVLVLPANEIQRGKILLATFKPSKPFLITEGGATRQDSVMSGIAALDQDEDEFVLIHDAARPGITRDVATMTLRAAFETGAALCAIPSSDTLAQVSSGQMTKRLNRTEIYRVQTPQVFKCSLIRQALKKAKEEGDAATDEASLIYGMGHEVRIAPGSLENIKLTSPIDFKILNLILSER